MVRRIRALPVCVNPYTCVLIYIPIHTFSNIFTSICLGFKPNQYFYQQTMNSRIIHRKCIQSFLMQYLKVYLECVPSCRLLNKLIFVRSTKQNESSALPRCLSAADKASREGCLPPSVLLATDRGGAQLFAELL